MMIKRSIVPLGRAGGEKCIGYATETPGHLQLEAGQRLCGDLVSIRASAPSKQCRLHSSEFTRAIQYEKLFHIVKRRRKA
jgi:hypothetical protein